MFLCCFSLKAGRKDLTNRPKVLSSHPHPTVFCRVARGFSYLVYPNSALFRRKGAIGGGGCRGGGGGVERELQACLSSLFFLLLGKNNTGTSFQITQVGLRSLDSDILENFSQNGGYVILARIHSIILLKLQQNNNSCSDCLPKSLTITKNLVQANVPFTQTFKHQLTLCYVLCLHYHIFFRLPLVAFLPGFTFPLLSWSSRLSRLNHGTSNSLRNRWKETIPKMDLITIIAEGMFSVQHCSKHTMAILE